MMRLYTFVGSTQAKIRSLTMTFSSKIRTLFRGDVRFSDLPREALRRKKVIAHQKQERRDLEKLHDAQARLTNQFASVSTSELLTHFRERTVSFFPIKELDQIAKLQSEHFPAETAHLIADANQIVQQSRWELVGLGAFEFKAENFWRCDPITGKDWGLDYHADVVTYSNDGADIRILWELNRFGHAVTLGCAYAVTDDEVYAEIFFAHVESWMRQNPYGRGANWNCAMEVALRAINLLAAFDIFRKSKSLSEEKLAFILRLFDQHGRFILDNNEFSYISTSNHYLSDVIGLFWIGTLMPELEQAAEWRDFGLREMLREIDKQILADGADFEASTGYHKFVTEMFLYTCILAARAGIDLGPLDVYYLNQIRKMLFYLDRIIQPDGLMPLIGDADGSQIIPMIRRDADDAAYLLSLGSVLLNDAELKLSEMEPEVPWLFGEKGLSDLNEMDNYEPSRSGKLQNAGAYVMRDGDLYLHFNANDCGLNGRGSHGHNDALSIEISAFGRPFIIDPGSYVYNLDREARHRFRSTAYHSTVMVDNQEQNTTVSELPFIMGNEARPIVDEWHASVELDRVSGRHFGYARLTEPVMHRRTVEFHKQDQYWMIEDALTGKSRHKFSFSFHLAPGISVSEVDHATVQIGDNDGREMHIRAIGIDAKHEIDPAFVSRNYGHKANSSILRWTVDTNAPFTVRFLIVPSGPNENDASRLELLQRLTDNIDN
ncbi:MAG: alginate lyase family protein [Chloracidobacterium sp.]|nr:alginate lyase family protein [Chloracidobacterium sp.]